MILYGYLAFYIVKPGVHGLWLRTPGFLKLLWFLHWYVCVCLCVRPRGH